MKAWGYSDDKTKVEVMDFDRFVSLGGILYMNAQGNGSLDIAIPKDYLPFNMYVVSTKFSVTYTSPQNGKTSEIIFNPQNVKMTYETNGTIKVVASGFTNVYLANVNIIAVDTTKMRYA